MRNERSSAKRSTLTLIALPVIALLLGMVVYDYGYLSLQDDIQELRDQELIKQKTLEKYITLIDQKPSLEKQLSALKEARVADTSKLIEADTPSLAAAKLQETVKGIITSRGGTISSERVSKVETEGMFKVINVSLDTVIPDARALSEILYSIETRTPYLVVKDIDSRVRNYRDPRELIVKLDISALYSGK